MEPEICNNEFGVSQCTTPSIANICPMMCKLPICKCGFDSCLNGGTFDSFSCQCNCLIGFTGNRCDVRIIKIITALPTNSSPTTNKKTTTTSTCLHKLHCINGAQQNELTCRCEC